ncbi:MAG: SDR family oxidoreductase [Verrucomicrobia bacterium]|nr:SDR family oxidoreductase [Verrucomicrobiota bacterium]MDA1007265.1 SDR family oxidoreductase [Verrucomicrobiota bacterium]
MQHNILLVGGNSGIGLALAKSLSTNGDRLLALSRSTDQLTALGIETLPFDATDSAPLPPLPETIDGLVYCPGTINLKPFHRLSEADFLHDLQVNLLGAIRILQAALPALKKSDSASVVLFSTVAVSTGMPFHASIAAAKGAVEGLTRSLAAEWAPKIRVNAIAPSLTDTRLASALLADDTRRAAAANRHPLKAIGNPANVAALATFLLSPSAQFITGQVHRPDGGLSSVHLF